MPKKLRPNEKVRIKSEKMKCKNEDKKCKYNLNEVISRVKKHTLYKELTEEMYYCTFVRQSSTNKTLSLKKSKY